MKRLLLCIVAAAGLAACETVPPPPPPPTEAPPPPPPRASAFHPEDFAWSTQPGSATLLGSLDYRPGAYTCADQPVILIPDAPFSRRRMASLYGSPDRATLPVAEVRSRQVGLPRDEYSAYVRNTKCDSGDRFAFRGLPAGGWFVVVVARPTGSGEAMAVMRHVSLRTGQVRTVSFGD